GGGLWTDAAECWQLRWRTPCAPERADRDCEPGPRPGREVDGGHVRAASDSNPAAGLGVEAADSDSGEGPPAGGNRPGRCVAASLHPRPVVDDPAPVCPRRVEKALTRPRSPRRLQLSFRTQSPGNDCDAGRVRARTRVRRERVSGNAFAGRTGLEQPYP